LATRDENTRTNTISSSDSVSPFSSSTHSNHDPEDSLIALLADGFLSLHIDANYRIHTAVMELQTDLIERDGIFFDEIQFNST
jgi:hypothetical protein